MRATSNEARDPQHKAKSVKAAILIAEDDDLLADSIATRISPENLLRIPPGHCGDLMITVRNGNCSVNGRRLTGIFFRGLPFAHFATNYCPADQAFCDSELSSVWLAALNFTGLFALNKYDAEQWYDGLRWFSWRRKMQGAKISFCPLFVGRRCGPSTQLSWMPYTGTEPQKIQHAQLRAFLGSAVFHPTGVKTALLVCGEVLTGPVSPTAKALASQLSSIGIQLAEIALDPLDQVAWIDTSPSIREQEVAEKAADMIVRRYHEYLSNW